MTRGFITVATGPEHYYQIARNLLLSYRYSTEKPYPFAIIAEEHNGYTELFDKVILTSEAQHSFMDKLLVLKYAPFDETIFIDADCLAYGDLNQYWEVFEDSSDFSAFGKNYELSEKNGWYNVEDIGKWGELIQYKTRVHLGLFFVRKSEKIIQLWNDCTDLITHYDELHFHSYSKCVDEAVMGVAMPLNGMKAEAETAHLLAALPCLTKVKVDIVHHSLSCRTQWGTTTDDGILLHFGTLSTYRWLYRFETENLQRELTSGLKGKSRVLDCRFMRKIKLMLEDVLYYVVFVFRKIQKRLTKKG